MGTFNDPCFNVCAARGDEIRVLERDGNWIRTAPGWCLGQSKILYRICLVYLVLYIYIIIYLGLFKVIVYFPNGKSTIWGIYSEYFLFFGHPLSKSKYIYMCVPMSSWGATMRQSWNGSMGKTHARPSFSRSHMVYCNLYSHAKVPRNDL